MNSLAKAVTQSSCDNDKIVIKSIYLFSHGLEHDVQPGSQESHRENQQETQKI